MNQLKMRSLLSMISAVLLSFGMALAANAGTIADCDLDQIPDVFDNCVGVPNGPGGGLCLQSADFDQDGVGDACDADFDNIGGTGGTDFTAMLAFLGNQNPQGNLDCLPSPPAPVVSGTDFTKLLGLLGKDQGTKDTADDPGTCVGACCSTPAFPSGPRP